MSSTLYYEDIVTHITDILRTQFQSQFRSYFEGDPIVFATSSLPALVIYKKSGRTELGPTGFDKLISTIMIKAVIDKREDIGASEKIDLAERRLRKLIEGRDDTTSLNLTSSIQGALRQYYTLQESNGLNPFLTQDLAWEYYVVDRGKELITAECWITFTGEELLQVPNRQ